MQGPDRRRRRERLADGAVHLLGLTAGIAGCLILLGVTVGRDRPGQLALALLPYAFGLMAMLGCSAAYNLAPEGRRRQVLRRLDHAAIFLMIAGTYTPIAVLAMGGAAGAGLLAVVWTGAAAGVAMKLLAPARFERASVLAYLLLGWVGLAALQPAAAALSARDLWLILAGGVVYSLGVILHLARRLPYQNALWHGCVLAAAICHFLVVLDLVVGAGT